MRTSTYGLLCDTCFGCAAVAAVLEHTLHGRAAGGGYWLLSAGSTGACLGEAGHGTRGGVLGLGFMVHQLRLQDALGLGVPLSS
jgi:hypothetical protein